MVAPWSLRCVRGRLSVGSRFTRIATIHGKNDEGSIIAWMRDGYLRYINKKMADAWSRSRGRQLPKDGTTKHQLGVRILQHRDVFKDDDAGGMVMRMPPGAALYVRGEREGSGYKHTGANSLNAPLSGTMSTLRASQDILTP
jgi:hypothetical protein